MWYIGRENGGRHRDHLGTHWNNIGGNEENLHYVNENSQERMAEKNVLKVGMYTIPYLSIWIRIRN